MSSQTRPPLSPRVLNIVLNGSLILLLSAIVWTAFLPQIMPGLARSLRPGEIKAAETAFRSGKTDAARAQLEKYIAEGPDQPARYWQAIQVCSEQKQWPLVVAYAEQGAARCQSAPRPEQAALNRMLAQALCYCGEMPPQPKARQAAERAYTLDPDDPDCMNLLGYLIADNATDPKEPELIRAEGLIKRALEKVKGRVSSTQQQLEIIEYTDSYGWVRYKQGDALAAVDALSQAIDDAGSDLDGDLLKVMYYHEGAAYHKLNRLPEARHALEVALQYDPKYAPALAERDTLPPDTSPPATTPPSPAPSTGK